MRAVSLVRPLLYRMGLEVTRYPDANWDHKLVRLLDLHRIAQVIDVGANVGQYALGLRKFGYSGSIISIEPLRAEFSVLSARASSDGNWTALHCAAGAEAGEIKMNVSGNSVSSSILPILEQCTSAAPQAAYTQVQISSQGRLDDLLRGECNYSLSTFLKIDTQGFERNVLDGAPETLAWINGLQIEASCVPLYEGQMLLPESVARISDLGMVIEAVIPGFSDPDGRLLQVDLIAFRPHSAWQNRWT